MVGMPLSFAHLSAVTGKSLISGFDLNEGYETFAFMNVVKSFGNPGASGGLNLASIMTADGYPQNGALAAGWSSSLALVLDTSTTWVLDWSGTGGLTLSNGTSFGATNFVVSTIGAGTTVSGSGTLPWTSTNILTISGTNGYIEFTNGSGAFQFNISFSATTFTNFTNLRIYRKSDQASLNAGGIFTPEFTSALSTLNPSIIRTMDWTTTNFNDLSSWSNRCQTTAMSYLAGKFSPALYGGVTGGTSTAYTCSAPSSWGGLVDGATVQVQFNAANTSTTPTLSVGGTAATTITGLYGQALANGDIAANAVATLVYNSWLNVWLGSFSAPGNFQAGGTLTTTMPIEIQVALCNKLNKHLWVNIPVMFDSSSVSSLATYIAQNLNSTLNCYFEFSNEVWNSGFSQTQLAYKLAAYLNIVNASNRQQDGYYGLKCAQLYPAIKSAWTGTGRSAATLRRVMAVWMGDPSPTTQSQVYRLNGSDLTNALGAPYTTVVNANYSLGSPTFSRPIDQCEVLSYAPYFNGSGLNASGNTGSLNATDIQLLKNAADAYNTGNSTAAFAYCDADIRRGMSSAQSITIGADNKTFTGTTTAIANGTLVCFYTEGTAFTGLDYSKIYYVVNATGSTFQVSLTSGGVAVTGVSGGVGTQYYGAVNGSSLQWLMRNYFAETNSLSFGWAQVAASYNGARPAGMSNLEVVCYEGGLQATYTSTLGSPYDGPGGRVYSMLEAYKNSSSGYQLVLDYMNNFLSLTQAQGVSIALPAWFSLTGSQGTGTSSAYNTQQWALMPGDSRSSPYQTYVGMEYFNNH